MHNFDFTVECLVLFPVYLSMIRLHISLMRTTAMEPVKIGTRILTWGKRL